MIYIYYFVDTDGNSLFTDAYDLYYFTAHNITYHSLSCITTKAHLYLEWIYFNDVRSANGYVDYVIIDGCLYFQTLCFFRTI